MIKKKKKKSKKFLIISKLMKYKKKSSHLVQLKIRYFINNIKDKVKCEKDEKIDKELGI